MHVSFAAGVEMQSRRGWVMSSVLCAVSLFVMLHSSTRLDAKKSATQSEEPVPAYHAQPPTEALPETLDPAQFDSPVIKNSYALAAKVKKVLYQQPCKGKTAAQIREGIERGDWQHIDAAKYQNYPMKP